MYNRHPNLPSISTLLSSPPPIIVIHDDEQEPSSIKQSYSVSSPLLSPIESTTSTTSPSPSPSMLTLPPLQVDDPPRRLSNGSASSTSSRRSSLWSSSSYTSTNLSSNNNTSTAQEKKQQQQQDDIPLLPASTQIVITESGQPILKRRRGRPPSIKNNSIEGGWTFLAPTVWDVKGQQPVQQDHHTEHTMMNGSIAAFSSSNMDMVLQIPRKKRGRKPKTHIVGNSCFAWKDNTAPRRRSTTKSKNI